MNLIIKLNLKFYISFFIFKIKIYSNKFFDKIEEVSSGKLGKDNITSGFDIRY